MANEAPSVLDFNGSIGCPWCRNGVENEAGHVLVERLGSEYDIDWAAEFVTAKSRCKECKRTFQETYKMVLCEIRVTDERRR